MCNPIRQLDAVKHVEKIDGVIAVAFVLLYAALMPLELRMIPRSDMYIYVQLVVQSVWILLIIAIVLLRKQRLSTLGFTRTILPYIAFLAFSAAAAFDAMRQGNVELIGRWFFYAIAVGGLEEILYRGFLHPRLVKWVNNQVLAILIGGLLFGAMHHIAPMVWYQAPWYGFFSRLGGGVIWHLLFLLIYASTGNIIDAILLHAALDNADYMRWMLWPCLLYVAARIIAKLVMDKKRKIAE